ncbi:MAG: 50S ribosomal protein L27 [Candidatus Magasanikbacteria bacterium RIFOXYD2_FULL_41_14]|uniref:Large ribosomal subunit protein bL27 n=1 Tax=Candidatus Magasanikbacteria bacterium RIFOXYD2_FULL_41_14 TaxID=1798709 RepID=A0A1F6PFM7_9BACT|nr:MAG: 50S ribosomal protein L27 [Candidatus Magasanikbacteria bacterium RIFOXYD2_FULL_41_14]
MSHKKAGGSTRLGRDSQGQRLGAKVHDGQVIKTGMTIVRQRGTKVRAGKNAKRANDDTIFAMANGKVKFTKSKRTRFDGQLKTVTYAHVITE